MAWGWGCQSCSHALQACSLVPRQQVSCIVLSRRGAEPALPCAAAGGGSASSPTLMTSGPAPPQVAGSVWLSRSGARYPVHIPSTGSPEPLSVGSALLCCQLDAGPPAAVGRQDQLSQSCVPWTSFSHLLEVVRSEGHGVSLPHPHHRVTDCGIKFLLSRLEADSLALLCCPGEVQGPLYRMRLKNREFFKVRF